MGRQLKTDVADEADWTFMSDPMVLEVVDDIARHMSRQGWGDWMESDDIQQDGLLWLSVRPLLAARARTSGDYRELYRNMRSGLSKAYARRHHFPPVNVNEDLH